jgi:hypothetical protein
MFTAQFLIPIIIEIAAGAGSAVFVANVVPPLSFGTLWNAVIGAIGGVALTWLTARVPVLEKFVEEVGETGVAADGLGGSSLELLLGVGVAGLLGGAMLITILGLIRNRARS